MTDINRIEGPSGNPETPQRREKTTPDADKFKKEMHKKVEKVDESDTEQRRKRKRREEDEPDDEVAGAAQTPQDTSHITPFSLEEKEKGLSPMEMQAGKGKISPMASKEHKPSPMEAFATPPSPALPPPSPEELEEDTSMWSESANVERSPSSAAQAAPIATPFTPSEEPTSAEKPPQEKTPAQPTEQSSSTQQKQTPLTPSQPAAKPQIQTEKTPPKAPLEKNIPTAEVHAETPSKEEIEAVLKTTPEDLEQKQEPTFKGGVVSEPKKQEPLSPPQPKDTEETEADTSQGIVPVTPTLTTNAAELESEKKKEPSSTDTSTAGTPPPTPEHIPLGAEAAPTEPPTPYATMNPQVLDIFERMAGVMTVLTTTGVTETTVTLNAPQFASSVFYGTQIIIKEYSTAPKAFNIQIHGTPQAVAAFQGNTNDLMAAFQHGNYSFRVNRLETGYLEDRPLFHRKESASGDKQDQQEPGN
ncbi:MAG: hypothetical protein K2P51_05735 [Rhabdochlamydiaceae bacterium]|nr:hypothetical protein [Rhabdochlamydiaceae bacterium]